MKRFIFIGLLLFATAAEAADLNLSLYGDGVAGSKLFVSVHRPSADFPESDEGVVAATTVIAGSDATTVTIGNLAPGNYAIAVFADLNGNGELDSNFLRMPVEPYGFSNDARGRFGPPDFDEAMFVVEAESVQQTIHLK